MTPQDPELVTKRIRVARDLEATFDTYTEHAVIGYDAFLVPALEEGESLPDCRRHLMLLKRRVVQNREELETTNGSILGGLNEKGQLNLDLNATIDLVLGAMRDVRHSCHGLFGPEFVELTGLKGFFPRTGDRLYSKGRIVQSSLRNPDLALKPKIVSAVEGEQAKSLQAPDLANHLEPHLTNLGTMVSTRIHGNRGAQDLITLRTQAAENFDLNIRGIVRIASGILRVAGHRDAAKRFRATLRPLYHHSSKSTVAVEDVVTSDTPPPSVSPEPSVEPIS